MATGKPPRLITVCSACLTEACWQGVLMCEDARQAGTAQITEAERRNAEYERYAYGTPGIRL